MTGTDVLLVEHPSDGIVVLRISRPQARNALNQAVPITWQVIRSVPNARNARKSAYCARENALPGRVRKRWAMQR